MEWCSVKTKEQLNLYLFTRLNEQTIETREKLISTIYLPAGEEITTHKNR